MKQTLLLLLCLWQTSFALFAASEGSINGKILDADNEAAMYANVVLHLAKDSSMVKGAITNEDGDFQLLNIPFDKYFIEISYVGFENFNSEIFDFKTKEKKMPTISLKTIENELGEVTVVAQRPILEMKADRMVLNVDKTINATGENGLSLLRKSPGVVIDNNENITLLGKSGVQVYINNKPSPLSGDDLSAFLKNLTSDQIDAIEIITNPSAKYDAEGNAGIINIRLKKDTRLGANANINLDYSIGQKSRYNGSINANYRNENFNVFGNYGYSDGESIQFIDFYKEQAALIFESEMDMVDSWNGHNFKAGADYFLNKKHTIGILADASTTDYNFESESKTFLSTMGVAGQDSVLVSGGNSVGGRQNANFNVNYVYNIKEGTTLSMDADYGRFNSESQDIQPNTYKDPSEQIKFSETIFGIDTKTGIDIKSFKADYEMPLLTGKFGAGIKTTNIETDNMFEFSYIIDDEPVLDENRSNNFVYTENVNAAYLNYSGKIKKFSYQAGLRAEQTQVKGDLTTFNDSVYAPLDSMYFNVFPSISLAWAANDNHNLQLSYSKRINRPNYQDLNPFEEKLDALTSEQGNPFLRPEYTDKIELRHSFKYMINTTLSYSHTNDVIARILAADPNSANATFITWLNIAQQDYVGLNISAPVPITKWWSSYNSFTAYYLHNTANYGEGNDIDIEAKSFNIYSQHTFTLPAKISVEVSGWYSAAAIWEGNFQTNPMWSIDAGIQKKILQDRGKIRLSISDIFYTQQWGGITELGPMYMEMNGGNDSRRFKINFSYLFGNEKVKNRNRKTGLEDETKRIKSD